jgi:hypothetical protein
MVGAVPAVCPVIEVDAVFAVAATLSISHEPSVQLGSWLPRKAAATRMLPLTCYFRVELRGFEPLTPSMRTIGALLLGWHQCSSVRVLTTAQDDRSAGRLLYLAAVQADWRERERRQASIDTQGCFAAVIVFAVTRMLSALFAALTALASAVVGIEHGVMVPVTVAAATVTAGTAAWMTAEPSKKKSFSCLFLATCFARPRDCPVQPDRCRRLAASPAPPLNPTGASGGRGTHGRVLSWVALAPSPWRRDRRERP